MSVNLTISNAEIFLRLNTYCEIVVISFGISTIWVNTGWTSSACQCIAHPVSTHLCFETATSSYSLFWNSTVTSVLEQNFQFKHFFETEFAAQSVLFESRNLKFFVQSYQDSIFCSMTSFQFQNCQFIEAQKGLLGLLKDDWYIFVCNILLMALEGNIAVKAFCQWWQLQKFCLSFGRLLSNTLLGEVLFEVC